MWEKFRVWYTTNDKEITWFLIGFLVASGITAFSEGQYFNAFVLWVIAFFNYKLRNLKIS